VASLDWSDRSDVETGIACTVDEDTDVTKEAAMRNAIFAAHVSSMVAVVLLIVISFLIVTMMVIACHAYSILWLSLFEAKD
jgi:hypothetical protein